MEIVSSKNNVPIRLTEERWIHITEQHSEMAGYYFEVLDTIQEPEAIYQGRFGEMLAVSEIERGKYLIAVYRELSKVDGFIITAFLTRRIKQIEGREKLWQR
jgi:hypothetical protein